jgi:hypothetical protein
MNRAKLVYSPQDQRYTVIDTHHNHLVLLTSSYSVAHYWRLRVNQCEHPIPYDILEHDRRVTAMLISNRAEDL